MTRPEILEAARKCVCGEREHEYGSPEDSFGLIAKLWTAYMGIDISALDVSMMMALLKMARIKGGTGTDDSFVDLAGYAACGGEIHSKKKEKSASKMFWAKPHLPVFEAEDDAKNVLAAILNLMNNFNVVSLYDVIIAAGKHSPNGVDDMNFGWTNNWNGKAPEVYYDAKHHGYTFTNLDFATILKENKNEI